MEARIDNPAMTIPGVLTALQALSKAANDAAESHGVEPEVPHLMLMRASQINGCSVCVDMHARDAKKAGESDVRLFAVGAWRDAPYFTDAERAALALTESVTRLSDVAEPVPDEVWNEAARHFDDVALAALVTIIGSINVWNRLNVATKQVAGVW